MSGVGSSKVDPSYSLGTNSPPQKGSLKGRDRNYEVHRQTSTSSLFSHFPDKYQSLFKRFSDWISSWFGNVKTDAESLPKATFSASESPKSSLSREQETASDTVPHPTSPQEEGIDSQDEEELFSTPRAGGLPENPVKRVEAAASSAGLFSHFYDDSPSPQERESQNEEDLFATPYASRAPENLVNRGQATASAAGLSGPSPSGHSEAPNKPSLAPPIAEARALFAWPSIPNSLKIGGLFEERVIGPAPSLSAICLGPEEIKDTVLAALGSSASSYNIDLVCEALCEKLRPELQSPPPKGDRAPIHFQENQEGVRLKRTFGFFDTSVEVKLPFSGFIEFKKDGSGIRLHLVVKGEEGYISEGAYKTVHAVETLEIVRPGQLNERCTVLREKNVLATAVKVDNSAADVFDGLAIQRQILKKVGDHPNVAAYPNLVGGLAGSGEDLQMVSPRFDSDLRGAARSKSFPSQGLMHALSGAADALKAMHKGPNPIIHRDVKPQNILVKKGNPPKGVLIDFDLAQPPGRSKKNYEKPYPYWDCLSQRGLVTPSSDCYGFAISVGQTLIPDFEVRLPPTNLTTQDLKKILEKSPAMKRLEACPTISWWMKDEILKVLTDPSSLSSDFDRLLSIPEQYEENLEPKERELYRSAIAELSNLAQVTRFVEKISHLNTARKKVAPQIEKEVELELKKLPKDQRTQANSDRLFLEKICERVPFPSMEKVANDFKDLEKQLERRLAKVAPAA